MRRIKGFTLIELLVVIAVIALLVAILVRALQRVKKQTKAVVCESRLRQWGLAFSMYTQDYDGKFYDIYPYSPDVDTGHRQMYKELMPYCGNSPDIIFCPSAAKYMPLYEPHTFFGSTFTAWKSLWEDILPYGSYGTNNWTLNVDKAIDNLPPSRQYTYHTEWRWKTCLVMGAGTVPVFLDCTWYGVLGIGIVNPPPEDWADMANDKNPPTFCMNRYNGGINRLFMDWSVRKVGIKELWTLKWHRQFDTANQWTKAGGVKPEDWPQWMRNFKDY